jgi:hypothetical protein
MELKTLSNHDRLFVKLNKSLLYSKSRILFSSSFRKRERIFIITTYMFWKGRASIKQNEIKEMDAST